MLDVAGGILIAVLVLAAGLALIFMALNTISSLGDSFGEAVNSLRKSALLARAQAGDASAYFKLAERLGFTQAEERNMLYRKAAEAGHVEAQFRLAEAIRLQPRPNLVEAARWFAFAASQGHTDAQCQLAGLHQGGIGVARDPVLAHAWFTLASMNGNSNAGKWRENVAEGLTPEQLQRSAQFVTSNSDAREASTRVKAG
jgi:localization factor PodJL